LQYVTIIGVLKKKSWIKAAKIKPAKAFAVVLQESGL